MLGQLLHRRRGAVVLLLLGDEEVALAIDRELGQMGNAQYLMMGGQLGELLTQHPAAPAPDSHVYLVEDQRRSAIHAGEDGLQREQDAAHLAARRDARHRLGWFAGVGRNPELHRVHTAVMPGEQCAGGRFLARRWRLIGGPGHTVRVGLAFDRNLERRRQVQIGQLIGHRRCQLPGSPPPRPR